jgi:DNA-binding SARP family transcriptional activator
VNLVYRVITLGAADLLCPDGRRVNSVMQQPKRFLLLVYLTLASRGAPLRRDAILHLFWPESDMAKARHSLSQSVYFLRRSLVSWSAAVDGHDHLRVDSDVVSCDALEMEAAVAAGDHRRALDLYVGDFLPGMFLEGLAEVETWIEERRAYYRQLAIEAARLLAREESCRGNGPAAAHLGRRLAGLAGTSEPLVLEAMALLVESGDRAGAAEMYGDFERRLRAELDVEPLAETAARARRLLESSAGCEGDAWQVRPVPSMSEPDSVGLSAESTSAAWTEPRASATGFPAVPTGPVPPETSTFEAMFPRTRIRLRGVAVLSLIVLVGALASWYVSAHASRSAEPYESVAPVAIAVRTFDHIGGDAAATVAQALPMIARRELAAVRGLVVVSPTESHPAMAAGPVVSGKRRSDVEGFDVRAIVRNNEGQIRVELTVWDIASGELVHAHSLSHSSANIDEAIESLGRRVASAVRNKIGRERRARESVAGAPDPEAWEAVQLSEGLIREARDLRGRGMVAAAVAGLLWADSLLASAEPLAPEWTGLSIARARVAAERAWTAFMPPVADRSRAELEFIDALAHATRAVLANPNDPEAWETRGTIAYWMLQVLDVDNTPPDELRRSADADFQASLRLDASRVRAWTLLGHMAFARADFASAYWATKLAYQLDVYHEHAQELLIRLFDSAYELGDDSGAERWCTELRYHFPASSTVAYCTIARAARRYGHTLADADAAWEIVGQMNAGRSAAIVVPQLEMMIAAILAGAGLADSADAVIRRARQRAHHDPDLLQLEAHARILMAQPDSAGILLASYVAGDASRRSHVLRSRRFDALAQPAAITASPGVPSGNQPRR